MVKGLGRLKKRFLSKQDGELLKKLYSSYDTLTSKRRRKE